MVDERRFKPWAPDTEDRAGSYQPPFAVLNHSIECTPAMLRGMSMIGELTGLKDYQILQHILDGWFEEHYGTGPAELPAAFCIRSRSGIEGSPLWLENTGRDSPSDGSMA